LEETLAWLLRGTGYELLVSAAQDPVELIPQGDHEVRVRGRGTSHQVDVLGEFAFTPAFSLPVRLFLEAKYRTDPCGIEAVRNAHGVIHDVNQNYMTDPESNRPRRRFQYCYALFSTSGFTQDAQDFALAHQISLVDLSGASFGWLRLAVRETTSRLRVAAAHHRVETFPVSWMRTRLRALLGTAEPSLLSFAPTNAPQFRAEAEAILADFERDLRAYEKVELLLGFPAAPFIIPLATQDKESFLRYARQHPSHAVRLRRTGEGDQAEWLATPTSRPDAYQLTFTLPPRLESWISENEEQERRRIRKVKTDFLSAIMVYYMFAHGVRACQLTYAPDQFRLSQPEDYST
jgi:hypothetical protein